REPALPWDEPPYIPPSPEKPEKGIKSPGCRLGVGMGPAFAQDDDASRAQHLQQMTQRCDLILGAVQGIDRKDGIEIAPSALLVEIIAFDRPCDLLAPQQKWLQVGTDELIGYVAGNQGAAASDPGTKLEHLAAEELVLDHEISRHACEAAHRPFGHG